MALHSGCVRGPLFFQAPDADVGNDRSGGCQLWIHKDEDPTPPWAPNRKRKHERREERENRTAGGEGKSHGGG